MEIADLWARIERGLAQVGLHRALCPPASAQSLRQTEEWLGGPLSPVLRELYRRHDGTVRGSGLGVELLTLSEAAAVCRRTGGWPVFPGEEPVSDELVLERLERWARSLERAPDEHGLVEVVERWMGQGEDRLRQAAEQICDALVAGREFDADPLGVFREEIRLAPRRRRVALRRSRTLTVAVDQGGLPVARGDKDALYAVVATAIACWTEPGPIVWPGFGEFSFSFRCGFYGHNPKTGAPMVCPPSRLLAFRAADATLARLNQGR